MSEEIANVDVSPEVESQEPSEDLQEAISEELGEAEESSEESSEEESSGELPEGEEGEVPSEENQAELKEYIRKLKLKVNGKEVEEELPFDLDPEHAEYLQKKFQMAAAGNEAMRTKSEVEKREAELLQRLIDDPYGVLESQGLDPDELAEMRIQQRIEEMKKSPEQLEQEKLSKEVEELRAKLKTEEEAKEAAKFEKIQKETEAQLTDDIESAIKSHTKLPQEPIVVRRIADAMLWAMDNGYPDVTPDQMAPIVEKEFVKEYQRLVEMLPENALASFIGKQNMDRLRKSRIAKSKKLPEKKIEETAKNKSEAKKKAVKKMNMRDFLNSSITSK